MAVRAKCPSCKVFYNIQEDQLNSAISCPECRTTCRIKRSPAPKGPPAGEDQEEIPEVLPVSPESDLAVSASPPPPLARRRTERARRDVRDSRRDRGPGGSLLLWLSVGGGFLALGLIAGAALTWALLVKSPHNSDNRQPVGGGGVANPLPPPGQGPPGRKSLADFEVSIKPGLPFVYQGQTELKNVRVFVFTNNENGSKSSVGRFWTSWKPGEAKQVDFRFEYKPQQLGLEGSAEAAGPGGPEPVLIKKVWNFEDLSKPKQ